MREAFTTSVRMPSTPKVFGTDLSGVSLRQSTNHLAPSLMLLTKPRVGGVPNGLGIFMLRAVIGFIMLISVGFLSMVIVPPTCGYGRRIWGGFGSLMSLSLTFIPVNYPTGYFGSKRQETLQYSSIFLSPTGFVILLLPHHRLYKNEQ